jgi:hypothetical protein
VRRAPSTSSSPTSPRRAASPPVVTSPRSRIRTASPSILTCGGRRSGRRRRCT